MIEHRIESGECSVIELEERAAEKDIFGLTACRLQHEVRSALPEHPRSLVNEITLPAAGPDIDRLIACCRVLCSLSHDVAPSADPLTCIRE